MRAPLMGLATAALDLSQRVVRPLAAQILHDMSANVSGLERNLGVGIATLLDSGISLSKDSGFAMAAQLRIQDLVPGGRR